MAMLREITSNEVLVEMEIWLWSPLNEAQTPASVRGKYREIIAGS